MSKKLKLLGVAVLFAVGGAASFFLSAPMDHYLESWLPFPLLSHFSMIPIPFALLSVLLFLRSWKAAVSVPLNVAVWCAAYAIATPQSGLDSNLHIFLAGLVGGFSVALSDTICCPRLLSPKYLSYAATVGLLAAFPFVLVSEFGHSAEGPPLGILLPFSFAIWQAAVGTCLYWASAPDDVALPVLEGGSTGE
jgi:hypothetical protein